MPFIRYSRDRRGYESTVVMHAYRAGQGAPRTRVLYMFRSPSNIKVGRRALDPEVMEALEHTHPDLAFDWAGLLRESAPRVESRERPERWRGRSDAGSRPPVETPVAIVEDESLLGRTLGAQAAARLRAHHNEVLQRIARRARTPEERDRLTERAARLNPDDWPDAAAIRAAVPAAEAEWEAIVNELPQRRRRRRGRDQGRPGPSVAGTAAGRGPLEASAIIEDEAHVHEGQEGNDEPDDAIAFGTGGDDAGDSHRLGPDPAASPADSAGADASADRASTAPSDAGDAAIPGGDDRHQD